MSGDIGPGDVVVCVNDDPCPYYGPLPVKRGNIYRITDVATGIEDRCRRRWTGIMLDRDNCPDGRWHAIFNFRKLNDGEDDAELIARVKSCRPVRNPVFAEATPSSAERGGSPLTPALNHSEAQS